MQGLLFVTCFAVVARAYFTKIRGLLTRKPTTLTIAGASQWEGVLSPAGRIL